MRWCFDDFKNIVLFLNSRESNFSYNGRSCYWLLGNVTLCIVVKEYILEVVEIGIGGVGNLAEFVRCITYLNVYESREGSFLICSVNSIRYFKKLNSQG